MSDGIPLEIKKLDARLNLTETTMYVSPFVSFFLDDIGREIEDTCAEGFISAIIERVGVSGSNESSHYVAYVKKSSGNGIYIKLDDMNPLDQEEVHIADIKEPVIIFLEVKQVSSIKKEILQYMSTNVLQLYLSNGFKFPTTHGKSMISLNDDSDDTDNGIMRQRSQRYMSVF